MKWPWSHLLCPVDLAQAASHPEPERCFCPAAELRLPAGWLHSPSVAPCAVCSCCGDSYIAGMTTHRVQLGHLQFTHKKRKKKAKNDSITPIVQYSQMAQAAGWFGRADLCREKCGGSRWHSAQIYPEEEHLVWHTYKTILHIEWGIRPHACVILDIDNPNQHDSCIIIYSLRRPSKMDRINCYIFATYPLLTTVWLM